MPDLFKGYQRGPAQLVGQRLHRGERPGIGRSVHEEDRNVQGAEAAADVVLREVADEVGTELPVHLIVDHGELGEDPRPHLLRHPRIGELPSDG